MKRISVYIIILLALFLCNSETSEAQNRTQAINLETVLELSGANSLTLKKYRELQNMAMIELSLAQEWWIPDLYAGISSDHLRGNTMNSDGRFFENVSRSNLWGGLGVNASWNFAEGIFKAKSAELKAEALKYESVAEQNQIMLSAIHSYYDFLAAQLYYRAYEQLSAQAQLISDQMTIQVEAGLGYESEVLLAKSNIMHLQIEMLNARSIFNNSSATLMKILNLDPELQLVGTDTVLAPLDLVKIDQFEESFEKTYSLRPELKGLDLVLQSINEEKNITTKGLAWPELHVGTNGAMYGGVFSPLDPTGEINAAVMWKIPLARLLYKGEVKKYDSKIMLQQIKIEQAKANMNEEVIRAREEIKVASQQTEYAKEGSKLAQKAMSQCIQRQQLGTARPFEILQAQEIYIKSRLDYLKAVALHNKAQYSYFVATGNNL